VSFQHLMKPDQASISVDSQQNPSTGSSCCETKPTHRLFGYQAASVGTTDISCTSGSKAQLPGTSNISIFLVDSSLHSTNDPCLFPPDYLPAISFKNKLVECQLIRAAYHNRLLAPAGFPGGVIMNGHGPKQALKTR